MLFVFTGTDVLKIAKQSQLLVTALQQKQPDAELVTLDQVSENNLLSLSADQGMFFQKSIVRIEKIFPDKNFEEIIKNNLKALVESPSIFVWSESELNKTWIKRLEKSGATVKQFGEVVKKGFDSAAFAPADALLKKDRKKLWLEIARTRAQEGDAEALFGMLWWQLKVIIVSKKVDQSSSNLKPFVYNKAHRSGWNVDQAKGYLAKLIDVQIQSKTKNSDMFNELERIALEL